MKKILALVLSACLAVSLAACGSSSDYKIGIPADATNGGHALQLLPVSYTHLTLPTKLEV